MLHQQFMEMTVAGKMNGLSDPRSAQGCVAAFGTPRLTQPMT